MVVGVLELILGWVFGVMGLSCMCLGSEVQGLLFFFGVCALHINGGITLGLKMVNVQGSD